MKKAMRHIFSLLLAAVAAMGLSVTAFAADSAITFNGASQGFDFQPGSEYTATDLFDNFKDVMPGDVLTETITFKNAAEDCDFVHLYMRAAVHDETANALTYSEAYENTDGKDQADVAGQRDETVATMSEFLSQLSMKVYNGSELIYSASPDEMGGLQNNVLLGTFRTGDTAVLTVELNVPADLGNEFANRVGEVDWVFHAEAYNESQLSVRKVWSDGNANHAGESVTVNLLKDGRVETSAVLNAANGWAYTFDRLVEGHTWTVEESAVPEGYEVSYETVGTTTTITNTKKSSPSDSPSDPSSGSSSSPNVPLDITVRKVWSGDSLSQRPAFVTVTLYNGGSVYSTVVLSNANGWTYHWKDSSAYGNWQIAETNIPAGYTPSYSVSGGTVTITNTRSLIQTGQLVWPILVLSGVGIALVVFGGAVILTKKKRGDV